MEWIALENLVKLLTYYGFKPTQTLPMHMDWDEKEQAWYSWRITKKKTDEDLFDTDTRLKDNLSRLVEITARTNPQGIFALEKSISGCCNGKEKMNQMHEIGWEANLQNIYQHWEMIMASSHDLPQTWTSWEFLAFAFHHLSEGPSASGAGQTTNQLKYFSCFQAALKALDVHQVLRVLPSSSPQFV
jgi:hypothetical protein